MQDSTSEWIIGKNALIVIAVAWLTFIMFGLGTGDLLTGVTCATNGNATNSSLSTAFCPVTLNVHMMNSTFTSLSNSFNCVTNNSGNPSCWLHGPNPSSAGTGGFLNLGNLYSVISAPIIWLANLAIALAYAISYVFELMAEMVYFIFFILIIFIPSLFSSSSFGIAAPIFDIIYYIVNIIVGVVLLYRLYRLIIAVISGVVGLL